MTRRRSRRRAEEKERAAAGPPPAPVPRRRLGGAWIALLAVLPLAGPVCLPGWFFGHDNMHLIRLFEQDVMVRAGEIPVRWYPDVAAGYGSPHPQYYAPLFYLFAQAFLIVGLPLTVSVKAAVVAVLLGTALAAYAWAREFFGEAGGVAAAVAGAYAPYHLLDLYVRTAFSELTVFLFLPLVLLAFERLRGRATPGRVAAAAASLGGLCLSHTITVMLVPPLVGGYLLLLCWMERFQPSFVAPAAGAALLGVGSAAYFLVPLVAEHGAVETEIYAGGYFDFHKHFVLPSQLLHSPWDFGGSWPGLADGMSFRLGAIQMGGCALAALLWPRLRRRFGRSLPHVAFAAAVAIAGIFMSLEISEPVWSLAAPLRFVQFPWRFLMLPAIAMPFLCAAAAAAAFREGAAPRWALALLCAVIAGSSVGMFGFKKRAPLERIGFGGEDYTDMVERDAAEAAASPTVFTRDFVRRATVRWFDHLPQGGFPGPTPGDLDRPRAEIARGRGRVEMIEESPARYRMRISAEQPSLLRLNVHRFPGWTWRIDGGHVEPAPPPGRRPIMAVEVPPGDHVVEAAFERTAPRWAGDLASLAAIGVIAALAGAQVRGRRPSGSAASSGT